MGRGSRHSLRCLFSLTQAHTLFPDMLFIVEQFSGFLWVTSFSTNFLSFFNINYEFITKYNMLVSHHQRFKKTKPGAHPGWGWRPDAARLRSWPQVTGLQPPGRWVFSGVAATQFLSLAHRELQGTKPRCKVYVHREKLGQGSQELDRDGQASKGGRAAVWRVGAKATATVSSGSLP